jgi:deoxyribodipyrimidine photolyase-related protein
MESYKTIRLILGDQLNHKHSWYEQKDPDTLYVLMECLSETNYVRHHIQKIIGFFLAMRHFSEHLKKEGHEVFYLRLDDDRNQQSISSNLRWIIEESNAEYFEYQLPDEYRLDEELKELAEDLSITTQSFDTEHFLSERHTLEKMFEGKKTYLMESFYRKMRVKYNILMEEDGKTPLTGKWNYDAANRKKLPKKVELPQPKHFVRQVKDLVQLIHEADVETIGTVDPNHFTYPVTRGEGLEMLDHFLKIRFADFGTYQDAMVERDPLLYHSMLSFVLNTKLLDPLEVIQAVEQYWSERQDSIDIAQAEGFIRQILGWREYMRGIYWAKMPEYANLNFFDHEEKLPSWFWTGETKMNCLHHAIKQSLDQAYAHHIQRLMVTGNFALLLGVHPDELDQWYLGIYIDAIQWVEITNTRGMSQFADGGIVGTKPYVSSANYIHKMSDYCANCQYDRKKKVGEGACPFNSLYWDFYNRHEDKLSKNPRVGMMYRTWGRMKDKDKILEQAQYYKERVEEL